MRSKLESINSGLDQLFFSNLLEDESLEDRANTIEKFLNLNGWNWDDYIIELSRENIFIVNNLA